MLKTITQNVLGKIDNSMLSYQLNKNLHSVWQKNKRFYIIELSQDLWGNWLLKTTWGSAIKQDFGRSISKGFPDYEAGIKLYHQAEKRRLSRGYNLIST